MDASETTGKAHPTVALQGVKVYVSLGLSHRAAKVERCRRLLPGLGAQLLEEPSSAVTHIIGCDVPFKQDTSLMSEACHVPVEWLEKCLALQKRVPEKDYVRQTPQAAKPELKPTKQQVMWPSEVQQALLHIAAGEPAPEWMDMQGRMGITPLIVVMLPGIDQKLFEKHETLLPETTKCLGSPVLVKAKHSGVHPLQASRSFLTVTAAVSIPSKKRKREAVASAPNVKDMVASDPATTAAAEPLSATSPATAPSAATDNTATDEAASPLATETCASLADTPAAISGAVAPPAAAEAAPPYPLEHYQVTLAQMRAANYPLPVMSESGQQILPEAFVSSGASDKHGSQHQRIVAVDCEMCYTRTALELTRLTLVGEDEQVLLDELVLPDMPIINYNTSFSGISPTLMKGVTTTLAQIQQRILQYIGPDTFLVGHSLENDLRVMKLVHLKNLDTAIMYPHARWPVQQQGLRKLADQYLKWTIQTGSHDSKEDAIAALRLVNLKLQRGPFFGASHMEGSQNLFDVLHEQSGQCLMLDRPEVLACFASPVCKAQAVLSDEQAVAQACLSLQEGTSDVIWLQLWTLAELYEARAYCHHAMQKWPYPKDTVVKKAAMGSKEECWQQLDAHVKQVYEALPHGSMLLLITGQGDTTQQRLKEGRAKDARQARQLAEATGANLSSHGRVSAQYKRDNVKPGNTLCWSVVK